MPAQKKPKKKKRTRRAVNARRSLEQREAIALQKLDEWLRNLEIALGKVKWYRLELRAVRARKASREADSVFGAES